MDDPRQLIIRHILEEDTLIRATWSGCLKGQAAPWNKVMVRPVQIKNVRHLQFSYFDSKKDISKNYAGDEIEPRLLELLALPFQNILVQTTAGDIQAQVTAKGRIILHHHKAPARSPADTRHDRAKNLLLPEGQPNPFLQAIGLMTQDGRIRADMRSKFYQINQFLQLIADTGELERLERSPIQVIDCGCGSAHLTFAVYDYLNHTLGRPAHLVGIDINPELSKSALRDALGWSNLSFASMRILDYKPAVTPDIVLALHACDTATDEALAQAIRWQSHMIFSVPCCHHHLQAQLDADVAPAFMRPLLRHGIVKERLGDLLTDTLRTLILQAHGYRAQIIEFISAEHTGKNLMIRAVHTHQGQDKRAWAEYQALKTAWQVQPYLETLL